MHAAVFVLLLAQVTAGGTSAFVGTWTANFAKSRLAPTMEYQSVTMDISVNDNSVTLATDVVDKSGKKIRAAETFRTDGVETPGTLTPGVTHIARWVGPQVLATVANKGGQMIFLATYEVSSDGKVLTLRSSGLMEQTLVFERK
jgi:hypothetical protein